MTEIIGVRFKAGGKQYYFDPNGLRVTPGQSVIVETGKGLEFGMLEDNVRQLRQDLSRRHFDYVIGSSHLHLGGMLDVPLCELTAAEFVDLCFENNIRAAKSGYFQILAHMDMYRWVVSNPERFKLKGKEYRLDKGKINELFSEMVKHDVALEINTHLMGKRGDASLIYPDRELIEIAAKYPLKYSYGSDAHSPDCVGDGRSEVESEACFAHCFGNFIHI